METLRRVNSKQEFFQLSNAMRFGNRLRQWNWEEYLQLYHKGSGQLPPRISVRNCNAGGATGVQRYRLTPHQAYLHCLHAIQCRVAVAEHLLLDESAPDDRVMLHAELCNSERHIDLRYALHTLGWGMRQAYAVMQHMSGLRALLLLQCYLDAPSWDNLCTIRTDYRDSVVELSVYACSVGVLRWNTLFWEVRNY